MSTLPAYLFVLPWSLEHLGGVNQVVLNLAREMKLANQYEPIVLILDWEATSPVFEEIHGIATVRWRIRPYTKSLSIKYKLMHWWWEIGFCKQFRAFCDDNKVAVINAHYPNPAVFTLARVSARLGLSVPMLSSFHGADLTAIKELDSSTQIEWRHFVSNKSKVVVCSSALKTKVEQEFGSEVNPFIVHNGLDADSFVATAEKDEEPESPYILSIGKFERKKGQDVLIKAFASLVNDYPDLRLKLVGASDAMLPELEQLCVDLNIQDRVDFHPDTPHSEVAAFLKNAKAFVLPSREEPFGIVILEAGAFALPVIASRVGGIPEILTHMETGRLVSPEDSDELVSHLQFVLESTEEALAMGERLREHVLSQFTWSAAMKKYLGVISEA